MKNWKTTLFGCTAMALMALEAAGVRLGHLGNTDYITFAAIACGAAWAWFCKDSSTHSTPAEVEKSGEEADAAAVKAVVAK